MNHYLQPVMTNSSQYGAGCFLVPSWLETRVGDPPRPSPQHASCFMIIDSCMLLP